MKNLTSILLTLCLLLTLNVGYAASYGITPELAFDKDQYSTNEEVKMSLKFTGIRPGDKTNSVTFEIEYDANTFELFSGNPETDIVNGYINFTTKNDVEKDGTRRIRVMYVDTASDIDLKESVPVFTVHLKVKSTATEGDKTFTLNPVNMYDSSFALHLINGGNAYTKTIKIGAGGTTTPVVKSFVDTQGHWAEKYVEIMASKKITLGLDENHFSPEGVLTRAQFAGFLVRALGLKQVEYTGKFTDVKADAWYAGVVETAAGVGIVKGSDGTFNPEGLITREQMAVMIMRAYEYTTGKKAADEATNYTPKFNDMNSISTWAQDYVKAANVLGIINGMSENAFVPAEKATRAQASKMIVKFLEVCGL